LTYDIKYATLATNHLTREHSEKIKLEAECDAEFEFEDFKLDEKVNSSIEWASSPSSLDLEPTSLTPHLSSHLLL